MNTYSLCGGNCDECRFRKVVPGTEERIDREPAMYCSLYDSVSYDEGYKDGMKEGLEAVYKTAYNDGYADGYDNAIEYVTEMLKNCPPSGGAHKQPGKDPEKEGNL